MRLGGVIDGGLFPLQREIYSKENETYFLFF